MPAADVLLPQTVTRGALNLLNKRFRDELGALIADAGLRFRKDGALLRVRADTPTANPLVYCLPLQNARGDIRADVEDRLQRDTSSVRLFDGLGSLLEQQGRNPALDLGFWSQFQLRMMLTEDPVGVLQDLLSTSRLYRFFRLGSSPRLSKRLMFLRILDSLIAGDDPAQIPLGLQRKDNALMTGIVEAAPASHVAFPLLARAEPLGLVVHSAYGAQILITMTRGRLQRAPVIDQWPVGLGHPSLRGTALPTPPTRVLKYPAGFAPDLAVEMGAAANRLLEHLTNPARWHTPAGEFDADERWIVWGSVQFGLESLMTLAAEWTGRTTAWTAFRALGTLQSIWEGSRQGGVPLRELVDPDRLRSHAIPNLPNSVLRDHAADIVDAWDDALSSSFPGRNRADQLKAVEELRHLVHGVGGQGRRSRDSRLAVLRTLAETAGRVQLVQDLAVIWWTAAVSAPEVACRSGAAPWEP